MKSTTTTSRKEGREMKDLKLKMLEFKGKKG